MLEELLTKYSDEGPERLGFVFESGKIIELTNIHPHPEEGAQYPSEDLFKYLYSDNIEDAVAATWHTHPAESSTLSGDDFMSFKNHPSLEHYIIGNNGVRKYYFDEGALKYA